MNHHQAHEPIKELFSDDSRLKLATLLMNLFKKWDLDTATQLNLLGLSPTSRALLGYYRNGTKPLPNTRDLLDRAGWILSIHKALRLLYPYNEITRYHWVSLRNKAFNNQTPLQLMTEQGLIGLAKVARYLDFVRGQ